MTALVDGVVLVMGRQLSTQLPGGGIWGPSPEMEEAAESCSCKPIAELALVDAILHKAPKRWSRWSWEESHV